jgi:hypothetical protein
MARGGSNDVIAAMKHNARPDSPPPAQDPNSVLFLNSFVDEDLQKAMTQKYGSEIQISIGCKHGQDLTEVRSAEFPEELEELTTISEALYHAVQAPSNTTDLVTGPGVEDVDIPLENPYWNADNHGKAKTHSRKNASYYVVCSILGSLLSREDQYAMLIKRRRSLQAELFVSAVNSAIYKDPSDDSDGQTMMYFHMYGRGERSDDEGCANAAASGREGTIC